MHTFSNLNILIVRTWAGMSGLAQLYYTLQLRKIFLAVTSLSVKRTIKQIKTNQQYMGCSDNKIKKMELVSSHQHINTKLCSNIGIIVQ